MAEPRVLMHIAKKCGCVGTHCPSAYVPNHHHILPQSWGGLTVDENMVWLCPNSHTAVHDLLNQYIYQQGEPDGITLSHYNEYVKRLADRAWSQRPSNKPPFTIAHPTRREKTTTKCEHEERLELVVAMRNRLAEGNPIAATAAEYITDALVAPIGTIAHRGRS